MGLLHDASQEKQAAFMTPLPEARHWRHYGRRRCRSSMAALLSPGQR
jgi:hypothetical protein